MHYLLQGMWQLYVFELWSTKFYRRHNPPGVTFVYCQLGNFSTLIQGTAGHANTRTPSIFISLSLSFCLPLSCFLWPTRCLTLSLYNFLSCIFARVWTWINIYIPMLSGRYGEHIRIQWVSTLYIVVYNPMPLLLLSHETDTVIYSLIYCSTN